MIQTIEYRLEGRIFYENAGLRRISVNAGFPGGLARAAKPARCSARAIRLMTNSHGFAWPLMPSFAPCVTCAVDGIFRPEAAGPRRIPRRRGTCRSGKISHAAGDFAAEAGGGKLIG
jgi:hypothetical protein